jgi:hypothetical protein
MSKIVGEEIPSYVAQQINERQAAQGKTKNRTDQDMLYLNARTSWIKLASGVNKDGSSNLAQSNILFNGVSLGGGDDNALEQKQSFRSKYNYGPTKYNYGVSEYGYQPMPGIVSADIRCMNRGSIKRATVQIKAFTPEQFNTLDELYLRIGYTMFLEWGHSIYLKNDGSLEKMGYTLIEADKGFFATNDYYQMLDKIEYYRQGKFGNYDGLICKVVNFSWHIAQDGSYDITLELISVGDVVESLKTNISPNKELADGIDRSITQPLPTTPEIDYNSKISPTSNIISAYLYFQKLLNDNRVNWSQDKIFAHITESGQKLQLGHFVKISPTGLPTSFKEGKGSTGVETAGPFLGKPAAEKYVTSNLTGYKETSDVLPGPKQYKIYSTTETPTAGSTNDKLSNSGVYYVDYNSNDEPETIKFGGISQGTRNVFFIDYQNRAKNDTTTGFYMRFGHLLNFLDEYVVPKNTNNKKIVKINYGISKMFRHQYQYSADPRVCLVDIPYDGNNKPSGEKVRTKIFLVKENKENFDKNVCQWKIDGKGWAANSMNIYIHHSQISKSLEANLDDKGNLSLFNFLKDLCNALNVALCGVNNLEPVIDEQTNSLHIVDSSFQSDGDGYEYGLELYGYNNDYKSSNFVRSFNLKTEITPEFATMASIGATAAGYVKGTENTMFSRFNKGLTDRFQEEWHAPTSSTPKEAKEDVRDMYVGRIWVEFWKAFGYIVKDGKISMDDDVINRNISVMTEFFKYVQANLKAKTDDKYASTQNGFIPISLGVTMDGISGIKIYNSLHVSTRFLPKKYPDNLVFIIKGVNHKLSNSDWETTLETVVVSKVNKLT